MTFQEQGQITKKSSDELLSELINFNGKNIDIAVHVCFPILQSAKNYRDMLIWHLGYDVIISAAAWVD